MTAVNKVRSVAVVTESFYPQINGVTNSVARVLEHLAHRGLEATVIAPAGPPSDPGCESFAGFPVIRVPSAPMPRYPDLRVALPWPGLQAMLAVIDPDVVHLADPTVLGAQGARAASKLGLPSVAIYQTDYAGFAGRYGFSRAERAAWRWRSRVHAIAGRTLAPSRAAEEALREHGVQRVHRWGRGVDSELFHPSKRSESLRHRLAPGGEVIIGYVGRLAPEKRLEQLTVLNDLPGIRLVIVGDGPSRSSLEKALPHATFLGFQRGQELAVAYASLDVFVHTGADETFCQAAQEAKASGVPVVAPAAGGLLDLVAPGKNGFLYRPDDLDGLRASVATLAAEERMRRRMSGSARRSVAGRTWAALGDELLGHYEAVQLEPVWDRAAVRRAA